MDTSSMKRQAAATVSLVVLSQLVHFLTFSGVALLLPLIREDLGISFAQAGVLSAAMTTSYALAQIPAGYFADRYGAKRLFFAGLLGWSCLALALSVAFSYWMAAITLFAAGACRSLIFAPGLALVSSWFPPSRRATAMSLFLVGSFIGTIVLSLTAPALSGYLGWRPAYAFYALLGICTSIAFWFFAAEKTGARHAQRVNLQDARRILRHRIVWVCNALQFIRFAAATAFNFWLPSLLLTERGFALESVGLIIALSAACAAAANPLGAYLSDRLRSPALVIGGSLAIVACTSVLLVTIQSTPALLIVIGLHSIFLTIYFGPLFSVPVEVLGQRTAGLTTGIGNLFANLGALASAWALGLVKDATGSFASGFYAIAALCAAGVVLSVLLGLLRKTRVHGPQASLATAQP
jgi:predicted MFS family arabinose efflux permease